MFVIDEKADGHEKIDLAYVLVYKGIYDASPIRANRGRINRFAILKEPPHERN